MLNIGIHQSFNGLINMLIDAENIGATTCQCFTRNNRNMKRRTFYKEDVDQFNSYLHRSHITDYVIHASYAMNPASWDSAILERTKTTIREDMQLLSVLHGNKHYVLHPGAYTDNSVRSALDILSETLHELQPTFQGTKVCLETMAGQGTQLLSSIKELRYLYDACKDIPEFRLCVDTCHLFGAGVSVASFIEFMLSTDVQLMDVIHVNNSKTIFGSRVDRHENLRMGLIPYNDLVNSVVGLHYINSVAPIILETPELYLVDDFNLLKKELRED